MEEQKEMRKISAKKSEDFSEWYVQALINSEFVDYTSVSGCIAFRPSSYFAWDALRSYINKRFEEAGIENVYFPMLIPERLLEKEKKHVEGFTPEVAWVTHTGNTKLDERLAIRPTSEAIMYESISKWVQSWRDLPMRFNQWNTVIRWEFKHPTPLLRSREFMWNEGHTVFATADEAEAERDVVLGIYADAIKECLAIDGIIGKKTEKERFAGAVASYSIEHMLPDGKAIQGPDFHMDGQNFSKAFDISFTDTDGEKAFAHQNTFAISTRELGVAIAIHGDDRGLVLPPKLAKIQIVIVPIYTDENREEIVRYAEVVYDSIKHDFRVHADLRDEYSPGWKFNEWEMKGIPIRIEVGKRELSEDKVSAVMRHNSGREGISTDVLKDTIQLMLEKVHNDLYETSRKRLRESIHVVSTYEELKDVIKNKGGFAQSPWCGSRECEDRVKEETTAKVTNMPFDVQDKAKGKKCIVCNKPAKHIVNFAKSY